MNRNKKIAISLLSVIPAVLLFTAAVIIFSGKSGVKSGSFKAPPFEPQAVSGTPDTGGREDFLRLEISEEIKLSLCTELKAEGGKTDIYFTSHPENRVFLRLILLDSAGNELYSGGLIKPGEYLKTAVLEKIPEKSGKVTAKFLSYEPETYYSAGTAAAEIYMETE